MLVFAAIATLALAPTGVPGAWAQTSGQKTNRLVPPLPIPAPDPDAPAPAETPDVAPDAAPGPSLDLLLNAPLIDSLPSQALPYAPATNPDTGKPDDPDESTLYMMARLTPEGALIEDGLVWRVYSETVNEDGRLNLVATSEGGDAEFRLDPGSYLVHASYGHAGLTSKITVTRGQTSETIVLNAGGLKLDSVVAKTIPLGAGNVKFDIYEMDFNARGERKLVVRNVKPGAVVPLNAATYHVISRYGGVNAVVRADIRVEPGKLTEATIYHNAAEITLKLVNELGGEAMANTAWSVLTPGGDTVVEGEGAFPSYVLAAGNYTVVARNQGEIFSQDFEVTSGRNREVEVLARTTTASAKIQ